jgi:hypothetical protein
MNTLLIIALAVAMPVYALLWHNQPAHPQKQESSWLEQELLRPRRIPLFHKSGPPPKAVPEARNSENEQWPSNTASISL